MEDTKTRSKSATIVDYLKTLPGGVEFTSADVQKALGIESNHVTSAFHRLAATKSIQAIREERGPSGAGKMHKVYVVKNLTRKPKKRKKTAAPISSYAPQLRALADVLASHKETSIGSFSNDELWAEMRRRTGK